MEWFSAIWNDYIRLNLFWVFLAGLVVIRFRHNERWVDYRRADDRMKWRDYQNLGSGRSLAVLHAQFSMYAPVLAWIIAFGIPATILDAIFGPK